MKEIKLYKHNKETYEKVIESWKTTNKVAVVQATGTGKSYIILKCLYDFIGKKKVVIAPSTYILEQLECEGERLENTYLITYSKLSYMTNEEIKQLNPSLIVFDEFHRCGAESWGSGVKQLVETFPNAKILGTSATNVRYLDNNRDMAEELFNGNIVTNLSLTEAIVKHILPMPKYVSALYTFNDEINSLKTKVENSNNNDEDKEKILKEIELMKNKLENSKGIPNIFKKHLNSNSENKFIIFCKNIQHLDEMKEIVVDWFKKSNIVKNIEVYTAYSGYYSTDKEVERFRKNNSKHTIKLLFSIDMFNEGIHIEDVTGVILLRPTISPIIYYQQIGRAIQVGKDHNPIIFDFVNNFDNIGAKNFIDDLMEDSIIEKNKRETTYSKNEESNNNDDINIYEFMIFDEIQEAKSLFESIEEKLIDDWESMYEKLKIFYIENKHSNITRTYNKNLAEWVYWQRRKYKNNTICIERINKLNLLEFSWDTSDEIWEISYNKLREYFNKNGSCNVRRKDNQNLYQWIKNQKLKYEKNLLDNNKIEKLQELNFNFDENINKLEDRWNDMYELLIQYKEEIGNCRVPSNYIYKNENLGAWVLSQRSKVRKTLNNEVKIKKLDDIEFIWNEKEFKWCLMYKCLERYKQEYGNLNVPTDYTFDSTNLWVWIKQQRKRYQKGILEEDRIKKLEELGFLWKVYGNN